MRLEFTRATKEAGLERCKGKCEVCGMEFRGERAEFHHALEASLGGDNSLSNLVVLHKRCHALITAKHSIPFIAKADRISRKSKGITRSKTRWAKRPMNGFRRQADGDMDT